VADSIAVTDSSITIFSLRRRFLLTAVDQIRGRWYLPFPRMVCALGDCLQFRAALLAPPTGHENAMRRNFTYTAVLMVLAQQVLAPIAVAQIQRFPSAVEPAPGTGGTLPNSTLPYTNPGTAPYTTTVSPGVAPYTSSPPQTFASPPPSSFSPALPPAAQPQAMQNLIGDTQRFGMPFDPYAQPAQYVGAPVPPPVTPYGAPPPYAAPYTATPPPPAAGTGYSFPALSPSWGGFYIGAEGTILEARVGGASIVSLGEFPLGLAPVNVPITSLEFDPDYDLEFSPRVWGGYKGAAGFGVRGRWWWYDHGSGGNFEFNPLEVGVPFPVDTDGMAGADANVILESASLRSNLTLNSIDLEGTQDGNFHNWDFQIAGGVRYAKIEYDMIGSITGNIEEPIGELPATFEPFSDTISARSEFSGVGPTIALAGRRPLMFADGLAFLVGVRLAFLFGDSTAVLTTENAFADPIVESDFEEHLVQVWEVQVGLEYSRQLASGARLFGAAFLEAQVWEWNSPFGVSGGDLGFFGPTVSVGIAR
jgi:hypothetical protein